MKILLTIIAACILTGCGRGDFAMEPYAVKNGQLISDCVEKGGVPMTSGDVSSSQYTFSYCAYKETK
jgi:uncharacterized lipoprotein YmbA